MPRMDLLHLPGLPPGRLEHPGKEKGGRIVMTALGGQDGVGVG